MKFGFFHSVEKNDPKSLVYTNVKLYNEDNAMFRGLTSSILIEKIKRH